MFEELADTPARRRGAGAVEGSDAMQFEPIKAKDQRPVRKPSYHSSTNKNLLWWDEVPPKLQFNPYIASGYRANLSYKRCMCTLFTLHNETFFVGSTGDSVFWGLLEGGYHNPSQGNVWLHFWPALFLIAAVVYITWSGHPHKLALYSVLVPQIICLLLSTTYHLFMAQVKDYEAWLRIDVRFDIFLCAVAAFQGLVTPHVLSEGCNGACCSVEHVYAPKSCQILFRDDFVQICGVFGVMMIPYFVSTWWGYHCQPFWGAAVLIAYYGCAMTGLAVAAFAKSASARAAPMGMLVLIRFASLVHRWILGTCSPVSLYNYFQVEILCTIGAFINVYRVPERWIHTKQSIAHHHRVAQPLDFIGNSHNIMHVLAVITMWNIYIGVTSEADHIQNGPGCPL